MKINSFYLVLLYAILISCGDEHKQPESKNYISDDLHKKFELQKPPQRIITLAPNLTELVFELGMGNRIIGNTSFCNYPDSAKDIPNVADLLTVNLERVASLKPDLIFISAEGNSKSEYEKLIDLKFKVFVSNPRHYRGIKKTLRDMGRIFEVKQRAEGIIENWESRLDKIRKNKDQVLLNSAIFLVATNPIISIGKNSFIDQIISYAGLKNISDDSDISYPVFNREEILIRNPDFILLFETNNNDVNELLNSYPEWNTLSAVVNKRVIYLNADLYSRPGPRFIDAVEDLHRKIVSH
ncbi:MAG: cobalamin-binding protein [Melioribacteraceae bacterium]|nr:cobalamin-binding protein [Melioribacteraceae bacterium]